MLQVIKAIRGKLGEVRIEVILDVTSLIIVPEERVVVKKRCSS